MLVGPATYAATSAVIAYDARACSQAKGREEPVEAWVATEPLLPPGYRPRRVDVPLVGRDAELGMLATRSTPSIAHGRAQLALLLGEAGRGQDAA